MTQGEPGVVIIFFYFFVKQGGFDYGYECMVPYGCSVSIFYAMWICYG